MLIPLNQSIYPGSNGILPRQTALVDEAIFQALAQRDTALAKKIMQQSQWNINEGVVSIAKG
ncbi:hypothetical protein [Paenibacillus sp. ALJ109b]|uniref:hypothetical protein n=1 Tax=Paenibacillus sp. ALJ109b TaxID=2709068 RepID=UPI001966F458|nr:hypothetical protein [Paenibacillus sp. ALJ109b]